MTELAIEEEASTEAQIRANIYRVFASFFLKPPTDEFLSALRANAIVGFEVEPNWRADDLLLDYHALFLVPTGGYVFPYESCYRLRIREQPGPLMGKPTLEVRDFCRRVGFDLAPEVKELPDHAGIEFSVMAALAEQEQSAKLESGADLANRWVECEREFFESHVAKWVPSLCEEIVAKAGHPYYQGFARWIRAAVESRIAGADWAARLGSTPGVGDRHGGPA